MMERIADGRIVRLFEELASMPEFLERTLAGLSAAEAVVVVGGRTT